MLADDQDVLSWRDVIARNPVVVGIDGKLFGDFGGSGEAEASTHGRILSLSPFLRLFNYNQFP